MLSHLILIVVKSSYHGVEKDKQERGNALIEARFELTM